MMGTTRILSASFSQQNEGKRWSNKNQKSFFLSFPLLPPGKSSTPVLGCGCPISFPSVPTWTKEPPRHKSHTLHFSSSCHKQEVTLGSCSHLYFLGIDFPHTQAENKQADKLVSGLKPSGPPALGRVAVYIVRQAAPLIVALMSLTHRSFSASMFQRKEQTDLTKEKKTKQTNKNTSPESPTVTNKIKNRK